MSHKILLLLLLVSALSLSGCKKESSTPIETLFTNGVIYTANENQQSVTTIGITDDSVVYVGNSENALSSVKPSTKIINLNGKMIIPGLHDVHIHLPGIISSDNCDWSANPIPYKA